MSEKTIVYDLIIVGGGINGAALARAAGHAGLKTILFEKSDFAGGTSSESSKLIHGGLRYLEYGEFGLVKESLKERKILLETAPHLVKEGRFVLPVGKRSSRPRWMYKAGMMLYDLFAGKYRLHRHEFANSAQLEKKYPELLPSEKTGAYIYSDCYMDDSRLCMENLLDAAKMGVELKNYCEFLGVEENTMWEKDTILEVTVEDRQDGTNREYLARKLMFALGPWNDQVLKKEFTSMKPQLLRSQGAHLFVKKLPFSESFLLPVPNTNRLMFVLPFKEGHLIGTTETAVGNEDEGPFIPKESEISEIEKNFTEYFPNIKLEKICTIAGVRPLAKGKTKQHTKASRTHKFHKLHDLVFSGVGGKYTTFRVFAHDFFKYVYGKSFENPDLSGKKFPGAFLESRENILDKINKLGFDRELAQSWLNTYGQRALELAQYISEKESHKQLISKKYQLLEGEVHFAIDREFAKLPVDFLRRRRALYFSEGGGYDVYMDVKKIFSERLPEYKHLEEEESYPAFLKRYSHVAVES